MKRIAVVGAGTMGPGIAQAAAVAGFEAILTDSSAAALGRAVVHIRHTLQGAVERGKLAGQAAHAASNRIGVNDDLETAVGAADLVVEAIVEDLAAKQVLFRELDRITPSGAILATNTSSLPIAAIAGVTARPERVLGMHFFNPAHVMKLVEVVPHGRTLPDVVEAVQDVARRMGKDPIVVRDSPGFASSRLGVVLGLEAMRMLEQGVASPADIDKAMELGYGHPMGPLRVSDLVGLDVRLAIAEHLYRALGSPHYQPPEILRRKVAAGELGKKTGQGFYEWPR